MFEKIDKLQSLTVELAKLPSETEWVEFKVNNEDPDMIGKNISALSNTSALIGKKQSYMVWGLDDKSHDVVGTRFTPSQTRKNNQELESWLLQKLTPKLNFRFYEFELDAKPIVILEIQSASTTPVRFDGVEYVRIGSYTKKLRDFPEKERELWRVFDRTPFEEQIAMHQQSKEKVLSLLDYASYFQLLDAPLPENHDTIMEALADDSLIKKTDSGLWDITNLGAVLFAHKLSDFKSLARKALRVIVYHGNNKLKTVREITSNKGYAIGYEDVIKSLKLILPSNEIIGDAFRREVPMYPELALRELVANALIHQDFNITGTSPLIEIYEHRIEIINPGSSLIAIDRLMDKPPRSRNEGIASLMRRIGICEERGSGIDKVVAETEFYQLPAPLFEMSDEFTKITLFAHREFKDLDKEERIRACYLHASLKYISHEAMNNSTLRERFGIEVKNSAMISRVIKQAIEAGVIKMYDPTAGTRSARYVPHWS
ncbi:ATP-binding protein [Psychrobacter sp. APC 3426]|uniref:ATP-binding protein n=1 Tax=Psychrobacter sp. APC 3426 TaxID=3035177 RepID=UPI0025B50FFA|nr:ATP-binding protein [Psychrobacter sp. APC 3426]MDN3397872.1 ATP-binding protein [Psychrobacter sp. APC 3426]